jgi:hypothetical protein
MSLNVTGAAITLRTFNETAESVRISKKSKNDLVITLMSAFECSGNWRSENKFLAKVRHEAKHYISHKITRSPQSKLHPQLPYRIAIGLEDK